MQARTDRRSSCSAEMFFAGATSCARLFFIQGNPVRLSTFKRAMLFSSCFLVFCGTGSPCLMFFAFCGTGTPACANQCLPLHLQSGEVTLIFTTGEIYARILWHSATQSKRSSPCSKANSKP